MMDIHQVPRRGIINNLYSSEQDESRRRVVGEKRVGEKVEPVIRHNQRSLNPNQKRKDARNFPRNTRASQLFSLSARRCGRHANQVQPGSMRN